MHVDVGPARRSGNRTAIYDQPLKTGDCQLDGDGILTLTIDASGIKCAKSRYRYRIQLTPDEVRNLVNPR
jgi:hypothetical protein